MAQKNFTRPLARRASQFLNFEIFFCSQNCSEKCLDMSTGVKMAQKKITGPPAHRTSNFLNFGKKNVLKVAQKHV